MRRSPWSTLTVLALAQFMVVLDITIVNVALPSIQAALGFSADNLQWVVSAYTLVFGGFLLLGGRAADLLGRRNLFMIGLALFAGASLAGGLADSQGVLIAVRAIQGLGGALLSPAALSILTVTFAHGRDRNIALGIWGGLAGLGGTLGVIAGGVLVDSAGWEWVFFVNVPIAAAVLAITPAIISESRAPAKDVRTFDTGGALLGTGGILALIYGIIRSDSAGWGSAEVIGSLAASVVLMVAFVVVESRSADPLVPLSLFRSRGLSMASGSLALNGAAFLGMFFLTALFLQQVRGQSALDTGFQFLPMGIAAIVAAVGVSSLVTRIGTRPLVMGGALLSVISLLMLTQATATGSYWSEILPGTVLFGIGIMGVAVPGQILAVAEVEPHEAGAASGVVSSGYQVGGALGLAVITTLATTRVTDLATQGVPMSDALVAGFHRGLVIAAAFAAANLVISVLSPQLVPDEEQLAEAAAAAA